MCTLHKIDIRRNLKQNMSSLDMCSVVVNFVCQKVSIIYMYYQMICTIQYNVIVITWPGL